MVQNPAPEDRPEPKVARVGVERLDVPGDQHAYVLRGARGDQRMVFLHGMCGHGLGYVQSFQDAAAAKGTIIALQGDIPCGDSEDFRKWSTDPITIDERIRAAFRAAGDDDPDAGEIALIGLSQGASRTELLVERFPERYTRAVFIGAPRQPSLARLRKLKSAVTMAGQHEGPWMMKHTADVLERGGVPAAFVMIPDAQHAQMVEGERVMGETLDFLFSPAPRAGT
jgi:pimeloyl-ACP methyl ester carboxylesterase